MALYDVLKRKPIRAAVALSVSILSAAALGLLVGDRLVPAMIQLSLRR